MPYRQGESFKEFEIYCKGHLPNDRKLNELDGAEIDKLFGLASQAGLPRNLFLGWLRSKDLSDSGRKEVSNLLEGENSKHYQDEVLKVQKGMQQAEAGLKPLASAATKWILGIAVAIGVISIVIKGNKSTPPTNPVPSTTPGVLRWPEASKHLNENVTIGGSVMDCHNTPTRTLLDMGLDYPNCYRVQIMISIENRDRFGKSICATYLEKEVEVRGTIKPYFDGNCNLSEIEIQSPSQIKVVE